jgi:hypothetical protein
LPKTCIHQRVNAAPLQSKEIIEMPWLRPKLIVLLTLCCLITVDTQAASKEVFQSGVWLGKARYDTKSSKFSRCTMEAKYKWGTELSFAINQDGRGEMFLFDPAWQLDEGDEYDITYQVDSKPKQTGKARVLNKNGIRIGIQRTRTFLLHVQRGYQLRLTTPVKTFTYGLKGTFGAVKKLRDCYYDHVGNGDKTADKTNPFAGGKKDSPPATNPFAKRTNDGYRQIVGTYSGSFTSSGFDGTFFMHTTFELDGDRLSGNYIAEDPEGSTDHGTLELSHRKGRDFEFIWTDNWGRGQLKISFDVSYREFSGTWSSNGKQMGEWDGRKKRSKTLVSEADKDKMMGFVRLLLTSLPDSKAELTIEDETPEYLKYMNPDLVWYYGGAVGIAHALPFYPSEKTALRLLKAADKKACVGDFVSASEKRSFANTKYGSAVVIRTACDKEKDSGEPVFVVYTFYRQKNKKAIRIAHVSTEPGIAKEADENFFQVLDRALNKEDTPL